MLGLIQVPQQHGEQLPLMRSPLMAHPATVSKVRIRVHPLGREAGTPECHCPVRLQDHLHQPRDPRALVVLGTMVRLRLLVKAAASPIVFR